MSYILRRIRAGTYHGDESLPSDERTPRKIAEILRTCRETRKIKCSEMCTRVCVYDVYGCMCMFVWVFMCVYECVARARTCVNMCKHV